MTQWNADGRAPYQQYGPPYQPPPPPSPPSRNARIFALIGSLVVLAVDAVGIVVVIAIRRQGDDRSTAAPAPTQRAPASTAASASGSTAATQSGPIDMCLVGNWRQSEYRSTFDFT